MAQELRANTAVDVLIGPFVDLTNGADAETGESPSVKLSKNGQTLAAKNDATTPVHDADGYYNCELDSTDTDTVGTLTLTVAASANALPVRHEYMVLTELAWDSKYLNGGPAGYRGAVGSSPTTTTVNVGSLGGISADDEPNGWLMVLYDSDGEAFDASFASSYDHASTTVTVDPAFVNAPTTSDFWSLHPVGLSAGVDVKEISGDATAADNLEAAYDGTGYDLGGIDVSELNGIVDDLLDAGRLDALIDAIKAKTDQLTFSAAGFVDSNVMEVNDNSGLTGDGDVTPIGKA